MQQRHSEPQAKNPEGSSVATKDCSFPLLTKYLPEHQKICGGTGIVWILPPDGRQNDTRLE
jgi:hypothetical protein